MWNPAIIKTGDDNDLTVATHITQFHIIFTALFTFLTLIILRVYCLIGDVTVDTFHQTSQ